MADPLDQIFECEGFQWDKGNIEKNWIKHKVSWAECEEVFFNEPFRLVADVRHSRNETRFYVLGQTDAGRLLFVGFTTRNKLIRIISARDMSRREKKEYEHAQSEETGTQAA